MITVPSPHFWSGRDGYAPRWLILHGTAGFETAMEVATYFASNAQPIEDRVSAHYVVGRDGTVIQCVQESDTAWSNGFISGTPANLGFRAVGDGQHRDAWWNPNVNPNYQTISIEHVKPSTTNSDELTAAQVNASFTLIDAICNRWNIPKRFADPNGGITGHFSIDAINRPVCPGPYPWAQLWQYFQGATMIPQGWTDKNGVLIAPNGFQIVRGFRDYVLDNNWPDWNWPVENEHGQTPLEISNTKLGGGTQQLFRAYPLGWTPNGGVFPEWTGPEILALRAKITDLEAQIARLTTPPTPPATPAQAMPKAS